jgi:hypothetical protein
MKRLFLAFFAMLSMNLVQAEYRMIVPQPPGGGTDIWARIVAKEWERKLGEKIIIVNIPGFNDITGFNKFHNELQKDPKVIMVAHGGNAESFLLHKVDYNYADYTPIGLQNLTIMTGRRSDSDVYKKLRFSAGSGTNPDVMAMTLLLCGPDRTLKQYADCFKERVVYVNGMKGNERRLAYIRGELNATRETTAAYLKHSRNIKENQDWFNHGVLDIKTGQIVEDPNFPSTNFTDVFEKQWGKKPSGDLYNAYVLVKNYRDVLQKSLWVGKNNPNADKLIKSLTATVQDPESRAAIERDTGKYEWIIGPDVNRAMQVLQNQTTAKALKDLVWWNSVVIGQESTYKEHIVKK